MLRYHHISPLWNWPRMEVGRFAALSTWVENIPFFFNLSPLVCISYYFVYRY